MTTFGTDLELAAAAAQSVQICLLGRFRVLKAGSEVGMRGGGKTATLLATLALGDHYCASRESLLGLLWPEGEATRTRRALNSLTHALRDLLGDALAGASPIVHAAGSYRLNVAAGVGVDVAQFDALTRRAVVEARAGNIRTAVRTSLHAVSLYHGDVCALDDMRAVLERERLRAAYLSLLGRLADQYFCEGDYDHALAYALRLLSSDPCREDGHRLVMRCYVRRGERTQALRQYRTCQRLLAAEFDARPEPLTDALFERIRRDPDGV